MQKARGCAGVLCGVSLGPGPCPLLTMQTLEPDLTLLCAVCAVCCVHPLLLSAVCARWCYVCVCTQAAKTAGGPTRVEKAKIGLIQFHLSPPKADIENTVVISDYAQVCARVFFCGRRGGE